MYTVYRFFIILTSLISLFSPRLSPGSINLFFQPAPKKVIRDISQALLANGSIERKLNKLHTKTSAQLGRKLLKNAFKALLPEISGFIGLHGGYLDYSDREGTMLFPVLQKEEKLYLVITPEITLTTVHGQTISHKNFVKKVKTEVYLYKKKSENGTHYWQVTRTEPPKHGRMSPLTIVLLTKPKNLFIQTGDFMTTKTPNFVLPPLYVVGNSSNAEALLRFLDIGKFFEPMLRRDKMAKKNIRQTIIQNIL